MDLEACLQRGWDAVNDGDVEAANKALRKFKNWHGHDGEAPQHLLYWADDLASAIAEAACNEY